MNTELTRNPLAAATMSLQTDSLTRPVKTAVRFRSDLTSNAIPTPWFRCFISLVTLRRLYCVYTADVVDSVVVGFPSRRVGHGLQLSRLISVSLGTVD